jgi:hypothetical protein
MNSNASKKLIKEIKNGLKIGNEIKIDIKKEYEEFYKKQRDNINEKYLIEKIINVQEINKDEDTFKLNVGGNIFQISKKTILNFKGNINNK